MQWVGFMSRFEVKILRWKAHANIGYTMLGNGCIEKLTNAEFSHFNRDYHKLSTLKHVALCLETKTNLTLVHADRENVNFTLLFLCNLKMRDENHDNLNPLYCEHIPSLE